MAVDPIWCRSCRVYFTPSSPNHILREKCPACCAAERIEQKTEKRNEEG